MQTKAYRFEVFSYKHQIFTTTQWLLFIASNGLQLKFTFENDKLRSCYWKCSVYKVCSSLGKKFLNHMFNN